MLGISLLATTGVLAGVAAAPASAADECTPDNSVDSATGGGSDIQDLLDSPEPFVCLSGDFALTTALRFSEDVVIVGSPTASLTAVGSGILQGSGGADIAVRNLTFAGGSSARGGAISTYGFGDAETPGDVTVVNSVFRDNVPSDGSAGSTGGAVYAYGVLTVAGSTFVDNVAAFGGAVYSESTVEVVNSTFVDNVGSGEGGAIFAHGGLVAGSTFLDNTSATPVDGVDVPGEAIYLQTPGRFTGGSNMTLRTNIFAGDGVRPQLGIGGSALAVYIDAGGNVFSTAEEQEIDLPLASDTTVFGAPVSAVFGSSPQLADNGGPTPTVALVEGSPAIDLVPVSTSTGPIDVVIDQRGEPRDELLDAGAFELQAVAPTPTPPPAPTGAPVPQPELAATGSTAPSVIVGGLAAAALLAGAALLRMVRRRAS